MRKKSISSQRSSLQAGELMRSGAFLFPTAHPSQGLRQNEASDSEFYSLHLIKYVVIKRKKTQEVDEE